MLEQDFGRTCGPARDPYKSSPFLKDWTLWKAPMLEQFMRNYVPWMGPHAGAGKEREEEEASESTHNELITTPIPCPPAPLAGKR